MTVVKVVRLAWTEATGLETAGSHETEVGTTSPGNVKASVGAGLASCVGLSDSVPASGLSGARVGPLDCIESGQGEASPVWLEPGTSLDGGRLVGSLTEELTDGDAPLVTQSVMTELSVAASEYSSVVIVSAAGAAATGP